MNGMTITSATYMSDPQGNHLSIHAVIDGENMFVPMDEANRHYQAILEWVAEGNTIQEAE